MKIYRDYCWKKGVPTGIHLLQKPSDFYYKIVTEPYHRYYVVEEYRQGMFFTISYDSQLFDFRLLQPSSQVGWQKEPFGEDTYLIRNLEERIVLKEQYDYRAERCICCKAYSPHGPLISTQKIFYKEFNDPFNGVVLYDSANKPVMIKFYTLDEKGDFNEVIKEEWDMTNYTDPIPKEFAMRETSAQKPLC